jgi:hypothetical protein
MPTTRKQTSVDHLSERLEEDIRCRGLREGDRYLTAVQAGHLLGVSTATAHRALKRLADQRLVVRRRNRGTFVGQIVGEKHRTEIRKVFILMPADTQNIKIFRSNLLMAGIFGELADVNIEFGFVPAADHIGYVTRLLRPGNDQEKVVGVVAISCSHETYRCLSEMQVPAVVMGSLYPGTPPLPSVDADHREAGRLIGRHLTTRGHRRIAMLSYTETRPGDAVFHDGLSEALTEAELPHNALLLRNTPREPAAFTAAARAIIDMENRPTAMIVMGLGPADTVADVAEQAGLRIPDDLEIAFRDHAARGESTRHAHVRTAMDFEDIAGLIGRMLNRLARGQSVESDRVVLPVTLWAPEEPGAAKHP